MACKSLEALAVVAQQVINLPVAEQFQRLFQAGLRLDQTSWENWRTDPQHLETIIPLQKPSVPTGTKR